MSQFVVKAMGATYVLLKEATIASGPWAGHVGRAGDVLSLNPPDLHWETRPAGADGAYEVQQTSGAIATYNPTGNQAGRFLVTPTPNAGDGALVMNQEPLG